MLPRKRPGKGAVVEGHSENNNLKASDSSNSLAVKKHCVPAPADPNSTNSATPVIDISSSLLQDKIMAPGDVNHSEIDEDLHSRQLAVYGRETMKRLFGSNVLISGINGLGAEIAKNLVLAGVKSVTLHDEDLVELWDLSSNFTFSENDVGKNRALASVQKLQELNNAVVVSTLTTKLTKEHLSDFQAVVFTDVSLKRALEFDDYCHSHQPPIAFIKSEIRGLFGSIFRDYGSAADVDGEGHFITSIHSGNLAYVEYDPGERSELQNGDLVVFSEIHGMTELNDGNPRKINFVTSHAFILEEDTRKFGAYVKGGIVRQVTRPKDINFKPLRDALEDPGEFLLSDSSKSDRPPLLHLAFQALDSFVSKVGRFPVAGAEEDAQQLISFATSINDSSGDWKLDDVNPKLLRDFAYGSRAVLNPMATMFGGIVGQEVVKACLGQCRPPNQFFYFDSAESLPTEPVDSSDFKPQNSRYDAQISVFGAKLQKKIEDAQVFVVGSGALGCEFLKNLALMGVSCGSQGKLTITDADVITKNDLSCQFLFRDLNIGQAKSNVAASAAASINPRFNIQVFQEHVGLETENVFDDDFWQNLTGVINASDNVSAGLYVDQRCLYFLKPLLESGALGAECYTQMAIPRLTERQAALCTARSFPHTIDHCLTWARSMFEDWFEKIPREVNAYLTNPEEYTAAIKTGAYSQARDKLESILQCLDNGRTFEDCITWARLRFEEYFVNHVKQLVYTFPLGAATNTGAPFWSGPKSFAEPLKYSNKEPSHLNFIMSASILRAETFNIPIPDWVKEPKVLARAISKVKVPKFKPQEEVYYSFHPKEKFPEYKPKEKAFSLPRTKKRREQKVTSPRTALVDDLSWKLERCTRVLPLGFRMKPIQLDKDDDSHTDLIAPLANLRAKSYCIEQVQWLQAKKIIAREVIPAFGNTTAMATGLVCLELYKLLDGEGHPYRNTYANLSTFEFSITQPKLPMVFKRLKESWTRWDRWELKGNPTIRDLIIWLGEKCLHVSTVSYGSLVLYKEGDKKKESTLDNRIKSLALWSQEGAVFPPSRRHLDVVVDGRNGNQDDLYKISLPMISVFFA